jgi:hypothetical protein
LFKTVEVIARGTQIPEVTMAPAIANPTGK